MRRVIAALACTVLVAGCASATTGTMVSEDTAWISVEGKGPSDRDRVVRDALAEAARLATANGYRYFIVVTADDLTRTTMIKVPGRVLYNQPPRANEPFGTYGGRAYTTGGSTYALPDRTVELVTPAIDIMVRMYRAGDIDPQMEGVFDATADSYDGS
jgi:hypothetical protein